MLHLEALENRCLLSNNSGLIVIAAAPAITNDLHVTDSIASDPDGKMDFGTVMTGMSSATEYIYLENQTGGDGLAISLDNDLPTDIKVIGCTIGGVYSSIDLSTGNFEFQLDEGQTAEFSVLYNPQQVSDSITGGIRFETSTEDEVVTFFGKSTALNDNAIDFTRTEIVNAYAAEGIPMELLVVGKSIDADFTIQNSLASVIAASGLDVSFYLSDDQTYSADDFYITSQSIGDIASGTQVITKSFELPADTVSGEYAVIAVYDQDENVFESSREEYIGSYFVYNGSEVVFDSDGENLEGYTDRNIDYGNVPVGLSSDVENITITNISEDDTIVISGLEVIGDSFSLAYQRPTAYPNGYTDLHSINVQQYSKLYRMNSEDANWATFNATAQTEITVLFYSGNSKYDDLKIYDQYGEEIFVFSESPDWDSTFISGAGGTYYIEFVDLEGSIDLALLRSAVSVPGTDIVAENEDPFTHTNSFELYNVYVSEPSTISMDVIPQITPELSRYYEFYGIQLDSYADFINYYTYINNSTTDVYAAIPDTTLKVYNDDGVEVYSVSYDFDTMFMKYVMDYMEIDTDPNSMTYGEYVPSYAPADDVADSYFEISDDIDLLEAGNYSFVYEVDDMYRLQMGEFDVLPQYYTDANGNEVYFDNFYFSYGYYLQDILNYYEDGDFYLEELFSDYEATDLQFNFAYSDSAFEIQPGESLSIPVTFQPQTSVEYSGDTSGSLIITDSNGNQSSVALQGVGVSGDLSIADCEIVADYPDHVQSDADMRVVTTISNAGIGLVNAGAELQYYLEDADGNTIPLLVNGAESLDLISYLDNEYERSSFMVTDELEFSAEVSIPADLQLSNYNIVVKLVQADENVVYDAETDSFTFEDVEFDIYKSIVIDSDGDYVYYSETDSDVAGEVIAFPVSYISNAVAGYVEIYNRDLDDLTINSVVLASGASSNYLVSLTDSISGDYTPTTDFVIKSGESQRVYVIFDPQSFSEGDSDSLKDQLQIQTSENIQYNIDLDGYINGGDLIVLDGEGPSDSANVVMPNSRIDQAVVSSIVTVTIKNQGNKKLTVSEFDFGENSPFSIYTDNDPSYYQNGKIVFDDLQPGESLDVQICFKPVAVGVVDQTFVIRSTDPGNNYEYEMNISGIGVAPDVTVNETSGVHNDNTLNFGNQAPVRAEAINERVTISNENPNGNPEIDNLYISAIDFNSAYDNIADNTYFDVNVVLADGTLVSIDDYFDGNEYIVVAPGDDLVLDVNFTATELRNYADKLLISTVSPVNGVVYNDAQLTVVVAGTVSPAEYSLVEGSSGKVIDPVKGKIDFGDLHATVDQAGNALESIKVMTFNIDGKSPIYINTISLFQPGSDTIDGYTLVSSSIIDSEGNIIAKPDTDTDYLITIDKVFNPGDKFYVRVMFDADTLAAGEYAGDLVIDGSYPVTYSLTANVQEPEIEVSDSSIVFSNTRIGQRASRFVTVSNTGDAPLVISGFECADEQFSLAEGLIEIAAGSQAQVEIFYEPTTLDPSEADFTLLTNDRDESALTITVTGNSGGMTLDPTVVRGSNYIYVFNNPDGDRVKLVIKYVAANADGTKALDAEPVVYLDRPGDFGNISLIEMPQSLASSKIIVSGYVEIADIDAGSLAAISGRGVDLTGNIELDGTVGTIRVDDIEAGTEITVSDSEGIDRGMNIIVDTIAENTVFNLDNMKVKTFQATDYESGSLTAESISRLVIRKGSLGAAVTSYDDINVISVKNDILDNVLAYDSIKVLKAGGDIGDGSMVMSGYSTVAPGAKSASTNGNIARVIVGGNIDGDIRALDGDIGMILASRGDINGSVSANNLRALAARNISGSAMAIGENIGKFSVKYDIIDSVIGVGYDFSSLPSTAPTADGIGTVIAEQANPGSGAVRRSRIGGTVSDSSIVSFL